MVNPGGPNPYLRTKILTASPQELRLMLYDGALRFCRRAMECLEKKDFEGAFEANMRAQKIVLELSTSLRHEIAPDLCAKLSALYTYIFKLLVQAATERQTKPLQDAIGLLEYERETWVMLMEKLAKESGQGHADVTAPQQTAISSLPPEA